MFGFLNVYKPKGMTSHDVVAYLRRITKIKQIGHTGTLDPFAEGVLPICIGKATRLIEYLQDNKAYIGTVQLGSSTTTYDIEGDITNISNKKISIDDINNVLKDFEGEITQIPPIYSAIKVNGKKLYEYARSNQNVTIEPRKVIINEIKTENFDYMNNTVTIFVSCSKGTYIRSIANDLGEKLGTYGHLIKLVRVKAGDFELDDSVKLEDIKTIDDVKNNLINPLIKLDIPTYELNENEITKVKNGNNIFINNSNRMIILTYNNNIAAIGYNENGTIKCKKVFI
jgi:tRNA pseudouridine55 synthase